MSIQTTDDFMSLEINATPSRPCGSVRTQRPTLTARGSSRVDLLSLFSRKGDHGPDGRRTTSRRARGR
jgi:hypothetical protein